MTKTYTTWGIAPLLRAIRWWWHRDRLQALRVARHIPAAIAFSIRYGGFTATKRTPAAPTRRRETMAGETRVYCAGHLTQKMLAAKLDVGLVCTDVVRNGHSTGDVAYFRQGTDDEIADCRVRMERATHSSRSICNECVGLANEMIANATAPARAASGDFATEDTLADLRAQLAEARERVEHFARTQVDIRLALDGGKSTKPIVELAQEVAAAFDALIKRADRMALDALTALAAAGIPTPEKGYRGEDAGWLSHDISALAFERDDARTKLAAIQRERDRLTKTLAARTVEGNEAWDLVRVYRDKRSCDGLNGRPWDALRHYEADQNITRLEASRAARESGSPAISASAGKTATGTDTE